MSRENVELVRAALGASSKFDMLALFTGDEPLPSLDLSVLADDVEVLYVPALDPQSVKGLDGLVETWREWLSAWSRYDAEVEEYIDAGDDVVALVRLRGETRHDGVTIEQPAAVVYTIEAGKVVRLAFHLDRRTALEEARQAD
jgi:ketosteroid isomerase-like protein